MFNIFKILKYNNFKDKFINIKYILKDNNQIKIKIKFNNKIYKNKLKQNNLRNKKKFYNKINIYMIAVSIKLYIFLSKFEFYKLKSF